VRGVLADSALLTATPHAYTNPQRLMLLGVFFCLNTKGITMNKKIDLVGVQNDFSEEAGNLVRTDSQSISQAFLDDLKDKRDSSMGRREGDYQHVASIPTIFVEKWKKEGFDIMDGSVPFKEIIKKLKAENLDGFMATEKQV